MQIPRNDEVISCCIYIIDTLPLQNRRGGAEVKKTNFFVQKIDCDLLSQFNSNNPN
jgi:hypothetical protein